MPTVRDRLLQRVVLAHLESHPRFEATSAISYGFTKGRTLPDAQRYALRLRNKYPWTLQADIVKFFDNIPREKIKSLIRRRVPGKIFGEILCKAVDCEIDEGGKDGMEIAKLNGIRNGVGLRQGMPVSPMLSNLLLRKFDSYLIKRGFHVIRYADDLAVFGESLNECRDALTVIQRELAKLGLKVPDITDNGKTTLSGPSDSIDFLGVEIKRFESEYRLCAPMKKIEQIKKTMTEQASIENCIKEKRNIGQVVKALDRFIIGHAASMAVLDDPRAFLDRLEAAKQISLRNLIVEIIGERALSGMDEQKLAILGVKNFPKKNKVHSRPQRRPSSNSNGSSHAKRGGMQS